MIALSTERQRKGLIAMTVRLTKMTYLLDRCSCCLADCKAIESLEIDPLCTACQLDMIADENFPAIRRNSPTELFAIFAWISPSPRCSGYGEYCGNPLDMGGDLCSDCHGARCDIESPRIPR